MIPLFLIALTFYIALVLYMMVFQRKLMYHPVSGDVFPSLYGLPHQDVALVSEDNTQLQLWYHEARAGMPTIVYFHGNAGHLGDRANLLGILAGKGLGVAALSYRGYGKSKGHPSEKGIYADARAAIKWVKARGIPLSNMAFFGESLGTGVAVRMASEFAPKALFLEAPYTSVSGRAAEIYWFVPVKQLIRDRFDSLAMIRKVHVPLVIFQGMRDIVIPPHHAQRLYEEANEPKHLFLFDQVGHTDFDNEVLVKHVLETLQ